MIAAYLSAAAAASLTYLALRRRNQKWRIAISLGLFLILVGLLTLWFINTGGTYGIFGRNGLPDDWQW